MKKRILSIVLALCLCSTSQSVVYAFQGDAPLQESISAEETTEEPEHSGDAVTDLPEEPTPPENSSGEEATDEPEHNGDGTTGLPENSSEEGTDDPEHSGDVVTDLPENSSAEETTEEPDTDLPEEPSEPENGSAEETTEEPDTDLPEEPTWTEEITDELDSSEVETEDLTESTLLAEEFAEEATDELVPYDDTVPTPQEAYNAMIALKEQDGYREGTTWTDYEPYSDSNGYYWKGGLLDGTRIKAVGCVAFAFILSDAAFGGLQNRMYAPGGFQYEDIKVGDILRLNTDTHTVIVLEKSDTGVVIAEGNYNSAVHWGRTLSKEEVMRNASHYITRYPEGYIPPDDPTANDSVANGTLDGGLTWNLTKAGTLTISGRGAMPDYSSASEQPWSAYSSQIRKVVIENGVTSIGNCAFWSCGVLGIEIPSSLTTIGNSAFRGSSIISVTIPSSVKTIGDSAFRECPNLGSVKFSEGLETIVQNAFRGCTSLGYVELPASIEEIGDAAFFDCNVMTDATFAPGIKQVKLGDNIFTQCYGLMNVTLPKKVDCIGEGMFQNCRMLAGLEIPQGAESIGGSAFASSGVSVVIIPDSVTSIGIAAFSACPLTDIYYTGNETQWNSISKIGDTASAVSKATIHYNYVPSTNPDDGDDSNNPSNPDDGDDSSNPSNPDDGDDSDNPSNPDDGDDSNRPGGDDNNNPGEDDSNKPGEDDNNNSNGNDNNNPDEGGGNASSNGDGSNSSNSSSNSNANTTTTAKADTTPAPVKVVPVEGVQLEEGYTAAQADVSRDKKLGADLLQTYAGQNMYLNAVFGTDFGMTIDMAGVPTVTKDLEIRYTLAEEPMLAPEFDVVHAVPNEITPLGFDAVFNFYVGDEHTGKKVYIYVLNAARTGYDLVGTVFVNEIGNIAFHSTYVTDAMIFIEK